MALMTKEAIHLSQKDHRVRVSLSIFTSGLLLKAYERKRAGSETPILVCYFSTYLSCRATPLLSV